ncbi:MAG: hypothetical protein JWR26_4103 [Pedosphaera sp.]|nr:hypothetical protein [Pedosphaera sp.]
MNPRNTWILVVLAAGLFGFIFFYERHIKPAEVVVPRILPDLKLSEVKSIQINAAGQKEPIRVERTNGGWRLTKPIVYPSKSLPVEDLLKALQELSPETRISAQELQGRRNLNEEYGFDSPQATLVVQQGDDPRTIKFGHLTPPGDQVYVQVVGHDGIDVVNAEFLAKFIPRQANEWRDTAFINLKALTFDRLIVTNGVKIFELQRNTTNQFWHMTRPMLSRADNAKIGELFYRLQNLQVSRFATDEPKADIESFGLQPAEVELTLYEGTNLVTSLQFGKSPTNDESQVYARRDRQASIVLVPKEQVALWRGEYTQFRDPRLASMISSGPPDIIEVRGQDNFTVQRQTNGTWEVTEPQNFPADAELMQAFIQGLARLEVVRTNGQFEGKDVVLDSDLPNYGLAPPARRYILKRGGGNTAGATNAVMAEMDFSAPKDGGIFARRADRVDESSVYVIKPADFQALPSTGLQLRERRIWNFNETNVTRVTIRINGKPESLLRKGPTQWAFEQGSQGIMNELAVEAGVQDLSDLDAAMWVERGDQNRTRYGFSDTSLQLSLELKKGESRQTLSLEFGGASPHGRYAMVQVDGQNWIFEFPARELDRLFYCFSIHENP